MLGVVESVMGGDQEKCSNGKVVVQIEVLAFSTDTEGNPGTVRETPVYMEISCIDANVSYKV